MKLLKFLCCVLGFIFAVCLVSIPFMFEADTITDWRIAAALIIMFFFLTLACFFEYQTLKDHERNAGWTEYLSKISTGQSSNSYPAHKKISK